MHEDVLETRLRRALNTEASMVNPSGDGLGRIRAGIAEEQSSIWWRRPAVALVAAAMVGLAVGGVAVALGQDDDGGPNGIANTSDPQSTSSSTPEPTSSATSTTTTSPPTSGAPATAVTVPVYFLHDDGRGLRLYREFHNVPQQPKGKIATAVAQMFGQQAEDTDYSSSWPADTQVLSVNVSGGTATVDLSGFPAVGADAETKSVQQLVYTVTATDKSVKRVRLLVNGKAPSSGHADWSQPVARAPMLDVQGLIWILAPQQGDPVDSPVKVTVFGTAYEGNVTIKVWRDDTEVASTFVTTAMGEFREASTTIELDPGQYSVRVYDDNAENGELVERDSKDFTVR
jgi:hypothetical protein